MKAHLNNDIARTGRRVGTVAEELPANIRKMMQSDAYWNKRNPDHQDVVERINQHFRTAHPDPKAASTITLSVNGRPLEERPYRPAGDPRFISDHEPTNPADIDLSIINQAIFGTKN